MNFRAIPCFMFLAALGGAGYFQGLGKEVLAGLLPALWVSMHEVGGFRGRGIGAGPSGRHPEVDSLLRPLPPGCTLPTEPWLGRGPGAADGDASTWSGLPPGMVAGALGTHVRRRGVALWTQPRKAPPTLGGSSSGSRGGGRTHSPWSGQTPH